MQSISLISKKNDIEALRQLLNLAHGEIISANVGILIPSDKVDGHKINELEKAGFKVSEISKYYITIN